MRIFLIILLLISTPCFAQETSIEKDTIENPAIVGVEILLLAETKQVIAVRPKGWKWGKKEGLPKFIHVTINEGDIPAFQYLEYSDKKDDPTAIDNKVVLDSVKIENAKMLLSQEVSLSSIDILDSIRIEVSK